MPSQPYRLQRSVRPALRRKNQNNHQQPSDHQELVSSSFSATPTPVLEEVEVQKKSSAATWAILIIIVSSLIWGIGAVAGFQVALGMEMALGFLLAIAGLVSPSLGLLSISMLAGLDAVAGETLLTGGLLRYNTLNYWLLIVIALYIPFVLRLRDLSSRLLQIFILLLALELIFSANISRGMQDVLNLTACFGMVIYFARSLKDEQVLYWVGVVNGVLASLGGLIYLQQINNVPYANPNDWTYFQLTALFSICISFPYARMFHKNRIILIALAMVNIAWIFLSGSRGSLLIALLCVAYLFLSTRSITLSSVMIAIAVLVGLWVSTQFVEQQSYTISRIQLLFDPTRSERQRTSQRSALARAGFEIFKDNPMGIGTGGFREESANTNLIAGRRPAHSAWIKTLAENGIPGILLMAGFIGSYAIVGFRKHQQGKLLFGVFITIVLATAFIAKEFRGKSLWYLAAAGIVLLHPETSLAFIKQKLKEKDVDYRRKLREVRFGRKK